jgi:hypothetical protein
LSIERIGFGINTSSAAGRTESAASFVNRQQGVMFAEVTGDRHVRKDLNHQSLPLTVSAAAMKRPSRPVVSSSRALRDPGGEVAVLARRAPANRIVYVGVVPGPRAHVGLAPKVEALTQGHVIVPVLVDQTQALLRLEQPGRDAAAEVRGRGTHGVAGDIDILPALNDRVSTLARGALAGCTGSSQPTLPRLRVCGGQPSPGGR